MNGIDHEARENASPALRGYYDDKGLMARNVFWYFFGMSAAGFGFNTIQSMLPLHMAGIGMDAEQISFTMSIRSWLYMIMVLYIAHVSDHWQSRWGRRLPFLLLSLPFIVGGILVFPWLQTPLACVLVFAVFSFFVGVKYDTYPLLSYDLVRQRYWGRVAGFGGIPCGLAVWAGQRYLMPMSDSHGEPFVYTVAAGLLLVTTVLTLVLVKEPPIRSSEPPALNPLPVIMATLRVGFSDRSNILLFLAFALTISPTLVMNYIALQGQLNLGLTQGEIGSRLLQWGTLIGLVLSPLTGIAIDKIGAAKTCVIGYLLMVAATWYGYRPFDVSALVIACVLLTISQAILYGAGTIFIASGSNRENIATFCACNGAVTQAVQAVLLVLIGAFIKRFQDGNYGAAFPFCLALSTMGVPILLWVDQKRRAGLSRVSPDPSLPVAGSNVSSL
jgi:Na+/melibiose symporter-like transporter